MKPAICISGLARGNVKRNINHLKKAFPDIPIFFSSWNETKNSISEKCNSSYYPEPQMHYNPWCECVTDNPHPKYHAYKKMFINKTGVSHQAKLMNATKQLIAHAYQLADIPEEYDMIIRTRWDTVVSDRADFSKYLEQSYNENMAIGFAIRGGRHIYLNKFKDTSFIGPNSYAPAKFTMLSVPSMLMGLPTKGYTVKNRQYYLIDIYNNLIKLNYNNSLFGSLNKLGLSSIFS